VSTYPHIHISNNLLLVASLLAARRNFVFRPRGELLVLWSLPFSYLPHTPHYSHPCNPETDQNTLLKTLTLGLFRRGVGSNQNAIITKSCPSFRVTVDRRGQCYRGAVPYYAPRR